MGRSIYPLAEKAYTINLDEIYEGFCYCQEIVYADSVNSAKKKMLEKIEYDDYNLSESGDEISYLNIPIIRCYEADKHEFEGTIITSTQVGIIFREQSRAEYIDSIRSDDDDTLYYLIKRGAYYRQNSRGYTDFVDAGFFDKKRALSELTSCEDITIDRVNVNVRNDLTRTKIKELEARLID